MAIHVEKLSIGSHEMYKIWLTGYDSPVKMKHKRSIFRFYGTGKRKYYSNFIPEL